MAKRRAMELPISVPGADLAARQIKDVAAAYRMVGAEVKDFKFPTPTPSSVKRIDNFTDALKRLAEAYRTVSKEQGGVAFAVPGTGGGGGGGRGVGGGSRFVAGPEQRLLDINEQRGRLDAVSDPARRQAIEKDLNRAEWLARRSIHLQGRRDSVEGPGLLELFGELNSLMKVRDPLTFLSRGATLVGGLNSQQANPNLFNAPGSHGPRGAGTAGPAWMAGTAANMAVMPAPPAPNASAAASALLASPAAIGAIVAVAAGAIAFSAARGAAGTLLPAGNAGLLSGGSTAEIARLTGMGFRPEQIAGEAGGLRERLANRDPQSVLAAARLGIGPVLPRAFGGQDEAGLLLKVAEGLRKVQSSEERLRLARLLGSETALKLASVSERVFQAQKEDADIRASFFGPKQTQSARDFEAQMDRLAGKMDTLKVATGQAFLPIAERGLDFVNSLANGYLTSIRGMQQATATVDKWNQSFDKAVGLDKAGNAYHGTERGLDAWMRTQGWLRPFMGPNNDLLTPRVTEEAKRRANGRVSGGLNIGTWAGDLNSLDALAQTNPEAYAAMVGNGIGGGPRSSGTVVVTVGDVDPRSGLKGAAMRAGGLGAFSM